MLAVALFIIGSVMITIGALLLTGRIETQVCIFLINIALKLFAFFSSIKIVHGH
jgi:hypothetical protein